MEVLCHAGPVAAPAVLPPGLGLSGEGDFCRGRVCTELTAVTCRVIYETFGAKTRYGQFVEMHGWLRNHSLILGCRMTASWPGSTRLLRNPQGFAFTRDNIGYYNVQTLGAQGAYSILDLAEDIRQLRIDSTYKIIILNRGGLFVRFDDVPRSESVVTAAPRAAPVGSVTRNDVDGDLTSVAMPYRPAEGEDLVVVKVMTQSSGETVRSLARTDGHVWEGLVDDIYVFIFE